MFGMASKENGDQDVNSDAGFPLGFCEGTGPQLNSTENECDVEISSINETSEVRTRSPLELSFILNNGEAEATKNGFLLAESNVNNSDCNGNSKPSGEIEILDTEDSTPAKEQKHQKVKRDFPVDENALISKNLKKVTNEYFRNPLVEVGRKLWESSYEVQHFTKGCTWSPDGTCILVPVNLDGMHVFELPRDLYDANTVSAERPVTGLKTAVHVPEGGTVYDVAWYPFMNSQSPETCCWISTRQHEPIHMWDAFTGERRCSYRGYDDVDEVEAAISIVFSENGSSVIGGYKKSIKVFDTDRPGRDCNSVAVTRAVSCFASCSSSGDTVTVGSWDSYIRHYDLRAPKLGALFTLGGHVGGVTWLRYTASNAKERMLFSGARKDNNILQWDMRNYREPVHKFQRAVATNQRIHFELSPQEQWLVSGGTDGQVYIWDLHDHQLFHTIPLHSDCCNGVSFNPKYPLLATSSGQFHFIETATEVPQSDDEVATPKNKYVDYENSLMLLWLSRSGE